jgi:hypothetical protein
MFYVQNALCYVRISSNLYIVKHMLKIETECRRKKVLTEI